MPATHTETFPVRYYECDPLGHVNFSNYLRYMQEAAFAASRAAGFGLQEYDALGQFWLVRENQIEYLKPARYGDILEAKTWVADFQRVTSKRMYEFRLAGEEELVARAATNWVYLDSETQRPMQIPQAFAEAFFPEGPPPDAPRMRYPKPPAPPEGVFTFRYKVTWSDLDPTQHMHNAQYLTILETAGVAVGEHFGWPLERSLADGFGWAVREARIEYKCQARLGEELEITTYLSNVKRTNCIRHYQVRNAASGELMTRAALRYVFLNVESGRPVRLPAGLLEDFAPNITEEPYAAN